MINKEKDLNYCDILDSYPILFRERHSPTTETCMCWGIEAGDGWFDPINSLCVKLERLNNEFYPKYRTRIQADQVKSKYGTLRFYYSIITDPPIIKSWLGLPLIKLSKFIKRHVHFKYKLVTETPERVEETWDEITEEEYNNRDSKDLSYIKNEFGWKYKVENGVYYRNRAVHHAAFHRYVLQNHKILNWICKTLETIGSFTIRSKASKAQLVAQNYLWNEADKLTREAEDDCYTYCEKCGRRIGTTYSPRCETVGWISYICESCATKNDSVYIKNGHKFNGETDLGKVLNEENADDEVDGGAEDC